MKQKTKETIEEKVWNEYCSSYGERIKKHRDNEWIQRLVRGAINQGFNLALELAKRQNETN